MGYLSKYTIRFVNLSKDVKLRDNTFSSLYGNTLQSKNLANFSIKGTNVVFVGVSKDLWSNLNTRFILPLLTLFLVSDLGLDSKICTPK